MKQNRRNNEGMDGRLPAMAPLANPYVPFQLENPPRYEAQQGLVQGTLYPGLDLPFMGRVNSQELQKTCMTDLQALGFAIQELALYLDTHRDDREALELYRTYQQMYNNLKEEYSRNCGPLNHVTVTDGERYAWLDDPWPWEYAKNKGV